MESSRPKQGCMSLPTPFFLYSDAFLALKSWTKEVEVFSRLWSNQYFLCSVKNSQGYYWPLLVSNDISMNIDIAT